MLKRWVVLLLIALLVIPVMAQDDEEEVDTTDWVEYSAGEVTFIAPPDWVDLTDTDDLAETMEMLAEMNPDLAETFAAGGMALDQVDILVLEPMSGANINALSINFGGLSLDDIEPLMGSQYEQMGLEVLSTERIETPLGEALRIDIETMLNMGTTEEMISQFQLLIVLESGDVLVMTFTPGSATLEEFMPTFDAVIESLAYGDMSDEGDGDTTDDGGDMAEGEFVTYSNDGLSITVPDSWIDVSDQDALMELGADVISESNPELASILEMAQTQDFVFFLLDPLTTANLNLISQPSPGPVTLDQLETLLPSQYESFGITVVDTERVELPLGEALRFQLEVALGTGIGDDLVVTQYQYILVEDNNFYFLTMGLATGDFEEMTPVFEAIAESLEVE